MQLTDYSQPTPLVAKTLSALKPGRVLDIGSYEGRNALYLARLGWEVVAIDTDKTVLDTLQKIADAESLNVSTVVADVREYTPDKPFDVVLCLMVLHFLPEKDIAPTIARMQGYTRAGGINIVTAFTADNPIGTRPYLFPANSLRDFYKAWNIRECEKAYSSWVVPKGKTEPERYTVARLVAINS